MEKDLSLIMSLTGCTKEVALEAYNEKNNDTLLAIDYILFGNTPPPPSRKRKREDITSDEEYLNTMRKKMEDMDLQIEKRQSTTSNPLDCEESVETPSPHEEMALQNSCFQECQIPSIESMAQTRETAYLQRPEYSFYSQ